MKVEKVRRKQIEKKKNKVFDGNYITGQSGREQNIFSV